jgi:hypothetical protein
LLVVPGVFNSGQRFATEAPAADDFERASLAAVARDLRVVVA